MTSTLTPWIFSMEHDPDDLIAPISLGRFLLGFAVALILVYGCAFLGFYLASAK